MTTRVHRSMAKAIGVFLLLWLGGSIWLTGLRSRNSGFEQLWQRDFGEQYSSIMIGSEGGIFVQQRIDSGLLVSRLEPDGKLAWTHESSAFTNIQHLREQNGTAYIASPDSGLMAIGPDGEMIWQQCPPSHEYAQHPPGEDAPPASHFLQRGILLQGLDDAGEVCWAVNTGNEYGYSQWPRIHGSREDLHFLLHDGNTTYRIDRFGGFAELRNEQDRNTPTVTTGPQQMSSMPFRHMSLVAVLAGGALLYSDGSYCELHTEDGVEYFDLGSSGSSQPWSMTEKIAAGDGKLLMPVGEDSLTLLDEEYRSSWTLELPQTQIRSAQYCAGDWIVLVFVQDSIVSSVTSLARMFPRIGQKRSAGYPSFSQPVFPMTGKVAQLLCIRDGRVQARMNLGLDGAGFRYVEARCSADRIYLMTDSRQLRCLRMEDRP